jgi:hypothetical protein
MRLSPNWAVSSRPRRHGSKTRCEDERRLERDGKRLLIRDGRVAVDLKANGFAAVRLTP